MLFVGLPIKHLQTIIPHEMNSVLMIVNGERSGQVRSVLHILFITYLS